MKKKLRKFGSGGMPPIGDSVASGNRMARQEGAEMRKMGVMPKPKPKPKPKATPSELEAAKSGARVGRQEGAEMKKLGMAKGGRMRAYAKGGKVKPINIDTKGLEEASRPNMSLPKADLETKALEGRNLAATRKREAEETAPKKQSFSAAFAAARKRGDKTFTWNGSSYGTKLKGEDDKPAKSANPYNAKTSMSDIKRNLDTTNSQMSDAQLRNYIGKLNAGADRNTPKPSSTRAPSGFSLDPKKLAKMTTDNLSEAAGRAVPRSPGMPTKNDAGKSATSGMSDAEIRKFMRDNERGYEETAARKTPNPIRRTAEATGTAAKSRLVEPKYAKGGKVTRGDGIARKGHTKGKMR